MNEKDLQKIIDAIVPVIEKTIQSKVNGKIDRMNDKLDEHIERIQPIVDFLEGAKVTRKVVLWFATLVVGIAGAIVAVKGMFK